MRVARKCSYCGTIGHNSRTCNNSLSHKHKQLYLWSSSPSSHSSLSIYSSSLTRFRVNENSNNCSGSCLISTIPCNKKGVLWTEDEHYMFLRGLEKHGKGNWRSISRDFVTTRTPTQVASHAQKHFIRLISNSFMNRTQHNLNLLSVGCESKTRTFEAFHEPSEAFGRRNFLPHWLSHHQYSVLKWPNSSTSTSRNCSPEKEAPDLELKLATPMPLLELTEACSLSHLS
ncbi:probable transcription factor At5g61620 [Vicia villosa]|uniref:probable transcription factor At5g61620 n=1 Tax=Vicia villosa TaxID=3911 RepID=UPI00273AD237|nr:probable transcription factor At5g61620 [Vicia villosa]